MPAVWLRTRRSVIPSSMPAGAPGGRQPPSDGTSGASRSAAGPLREPQHAERGERLGHGARLEPRIGRDVADRADPRDVAAVDHGERRPRHLRRSEGGACRALDARGEVAYWQASHSSPLRIASIEQAAAATRATVGPSIVEAPSVRR